MRFDGNHKLTWFRPGAAALLVALGVADGVRPAFCKVVGVTETFSGQGSYASVDGRFTGLDNDGWQIAGDGQITDEGYLFTNRGIGVEEGEQDRLIMPLQGMGSFRDRIIVHDLDLGEGITRALGEFYFIHILGPRENRVSFVVVENADTGDNAWTLHIVDGTTGVIEHDIPRGTDVSFEFTFMEATQFVELSYDFDIYDGEPGVVFGPISYSGLFVEEEHRVQIGMGAAGSSGRANGTLALFEVLPVSDVPGDFNGNGLLDAADIDQLSDEVRAATNDVTYDLNADTLVNDLDRQFWIHDLKSTYFGDADLNGAFDSTDLVQVLASGEYEDDVELNSTWLTGDWDGDGDFTSGDLVVALADGGYESGAAAVPEPSGGMLAIVAAVLAATTQRPKTRRE